MGHRWAVESRAMLATGGTGKPGHPPLGIYLPPPLRQTHEPFITYSAIRESASGHVYLAHNEYTIPQWVYQDE